MNAGETIGIISGVIAPLSGVGAVLKWCKDGRHKMGDSWMSIENIHSFFLCHWLKKYWGVMLGNILSAVHFFFLILTPSMKEKEIESFFKNSFNGTEEFQDGVLARFREFRMSPETGMNFLYALRYLQQNHYLGFVDLTWFHFSKGWSSAVVFHRVCLEPVPRTL